MRIGAEEKKGKGKKWKGYGKEGMGLIRAEETMGRRKKVEDMGRGEYGKGERG